jgi:hypothetical protein
MSTPFVFLGAIIVNLVVKKIISIARRRTFELKKFKDRAGALTTFVFTSFYTLVVSAGVTPFICFKREDGTYGLKQNPSNNCYDKEWFDILPTAVFFIVLYAISIPATLSIILYQNRNNLNSSLFLKNYGHLTRSFKRSYFYWEVVMLMRRATFVLVGQVGTLSNSGNLSPYFFTIVILFCFHSLELFCLPYKRVTTFMRSATWSVVSIVVLLCDGFIFKSAVVSQVEKILFAVLMLLLLIGAIISSILSLISCLFKSGLCVKKKNDAINVHLPVPGEVSFLTVQGIDLELFEEILDEVEEVPHISKVISIVAEIQLSSDERTPDQVSSAAQQPVIVETSLAALEAPRGNLIGPPQTSSTSPL